MRDCVTAVLGILVLSVASNVSASSLPAQILCTPDEHSRVGLSKIDIPGSQAHLFEYGGKVTTTRKGTTTNYSYGQGQDFYKLKDKTSYSKDFANLQLDLFIVSDPNWADSSGILILQGQPTGAFFHIDWATRRYYGYVPEFGGLDAYAGSCTILKK